MWYGGMLERVRSACFGISSVPHWTSAARPSGHRSIPSQCQPMTDAIADIRADIICVDLSEMNSVFDVSKVGLSDLWLVSGPISIEL